MLGFRDGNFTQLRGLLFLWMVHCVPWDNVLLDGVNMLSSFMLLFSLEFSCMAARC